MQRLTLSGILTLFVFAAACASHSTPSTATSTAPEKRLASATVTFSSLQDGKDAKSAVSVQLLRSGNELAADGTASGTEFKQNTTAAPLALSIKGPFGRDDASAGQLRLRLTPDGDDTWTFDVQLALHYADETQQNYRWQSVRLDEKAPERTLVLAGAQQP
jgi:hypothetical protein